MPVPDPVSSSSATDVAELYAALAERLQRIVRSEVRAPEVVIEDACQVAWSRFVRHCDRVNHEAALAWLARTAVREACRLARRDARELSLDLELQTAGDGLGATVMPGPEQLVEQRDRLAALSGLPERQRRLLWLQAIGLGYAEIASYTGDSPRTIDRQLVRARRRVRALAG
jgi:RNA polymerase sigma factor (sigma-70 family)